MKNNLVETVRFCFTNQVITRLGAAVDEASPDVAKALEKAIPLVLNALVVQAGHEGEPANLLQLAREADAAGTLEQLPDFEENTWHEQGSNLLLDLLGNNYRNTVNQLAASVGIRPIAAGTLLQVAAMAVLGVLGRFAANNDLTPTEFISWLQAQEHEIAAAMLPSGAAVNLAATPEAELMPPTLPPTSGSMPLAQMPAPPRLASPPRRAAVRPTAPALGPAPASRNMGQVWQWGILLLLVAGFSYYLGRDRQTVDTSNSTATSSSTTKTETSAVAPLTMPKVAGRYDQDQDTYIYDTGTPTTIILADGSTQRVGANSTENRLYTFLATPSIQVDSVNRTKGWINFDRVNFEAGKATLMPGSEQQLRNIAGILKTFPNAVVKIGGYTDSTGVPLHNLQISEERAKTAMMALATMGVNAEHLQSKGYGAKYYVAPNSTPIGRALNRRISVRVIKK
jgi:OOP family OmpA-OmpF porin